MCRVLSISRSGYYEWLSRGESLRSMAYAKDSKEIISIYETSQKRYGSYKIHAELSSRGIKTSRNRVARIMKKQGIKSIVNKKHRVQTTDSNHSNRIAENLLKRNFYPQTPSHAWVSDITYVHTQQGWLYLTTIIDLFDRRVIGWSLSDNMTTEHTIIKAWNMAITNREPESGMIFHSDQGVQYTANSFRCLLKDKSIKQSMSRKGNCWDNAVAECFFKIIKSEMIDHRYYYSHLQAKMDIVYFIEVWYNKKRRHAALQYQTPDEYGKSKYLTAA